MSILIDENTRVLIQGITGREGSFHARSCIEYGTKVVAGVTPGKGGTKMDDVPVFDTVDRAVKETGATASMIYVPGAFAAEAMMEAIDAGLSVVACITDGVPTLDMVVVKKYLYGKSTRLIGPNCPGLISPGKCKMGIMPSPIHLPGHVGVVSRSGTLTFETVAQLTEQGVGQSTCIGIGGDPIVGTSFIDVLAMFQADPDTNAVVIIGEIGGTAEQEAAEFVRTKMNKPVVGFIAGQTAPPGKRMGHAGAIVSGGTGTAAEKIAAFEAAGIPAVKTPAEIGLTMAKVLKEKGL